MSSLDNGELELMLHRNPDMSDMLGGTAPIHTKSKYSRILGPGLTDTSTVFPVIRLIVDTPQGN